MRGKLKVFLGYAAGTGKTYRMLEEGQKLKEQGVDVVIGYFEQHGRKDTIAKAEGLETIRRKGLGYRGSHFEEMDTEAKNGAKGSTAVTPVVAVSITANDTDATIGTGSALSLSGDLEAKAALTDQVSTSAEGDTESDDTGVGISIAVAVVNDHALASTDRNLSATGTVTFGASAISGSEAIAKASVKGGQQDDNSGSHDDSNPNNQSVDNATNKQTKFSSDKAKEKDSGAKGSEGASNDKSSTSSGGVSVAGAVAVAIENASSKAYVDNGAHVTSGGMLSVTSA